VSYDFRGKEVLKGGEHRATAKSPARAKRMVNLLRGVEHGWKPTGQPARDKKSRGKSPRSRSGR